MSEIVLDELFSLQKGLDEEIHQKHHVDLRETHYKRILALLVELGEFANETRCFKFWSLKPASEKGVILDEYADGMHFFLSLGIPLGVEKYAPHVRQRRSRIDPPDPQDLFARERSPLFLRREALRPCLLEFLEPFASIGL
jgi:hypothetical protein